MTFERSLKGIHAACKNIMGQYTVIFLPAVVHCDYVAISYRLGGTYSACIGHVTTSDLQ